MIWREYFGPIGDNLGVIVVGLIVLMIAIYNNRARARAREEATEMRKEYRDAIISGVVVAIGGTILISLIQRRVAWAFLFTITIFYPILKLYLNKRRARAQ